MSERYTAFYTTRPFWVIEAIDIDDPQVSSKFHEHMQEIVFSHDEELFKLKVCRDGKIMLQIPHLEETSPFDDDHDLSVSVAWWSEYMQYLNCTLLLLDSCVMEEMNLAYLELKELSQNDAIRVELDGDAIKGENIAMQSYAALYQMGTFLSTYGLPPQFDPRMIMRQVLTEDVFKSLVDKTTIAYRDPELVSHLSTLAKSLSEYKAGNYPISLILAWLIVESMLSLNWRGYLDRQNQEFENGSKRINADRMKVLTEGRDYPISVVSNYLELEGELSHDLFRTVDRVRTWRNKIVHQDPNFTCSANHAKDSINLALEMVPQATTLQLTLNFTYGVHGP